MTLRIYSSRPDFLVAAGISRSQTQLEVSLRRISSGLRINQSRDDVAGLAISERFTAQLRGALASIQNMNSGISLLQVVEGAMNESALALQRMRELSVAAASETLNDQDREALNIEFQLLSHHLDAIAEQTNYNGVKLLSGSHQSLELQVGSNSSDRFKINLARLDAVELGRQARYRTERRGVFISDMETGDLKINGVAIRASVAADDTISYSFGRGSSIAKAAAINAVTEFTGVRAIVGHNVIRAFEPIREISLDSLNYFSVNGHPITGIHVEAKDSSGALVELVNAGFEQTGVKAHIDGEGFLILTAEDGRNITVEYGGPQVRDAIRMIDYHGDPINLIDTIDPVVSDLDGDIAEITFEGTGSYDGSYQVIGDVSIVGLTTSDSTGGFERPRDNVDVVLEVVNPGDLGEATFRFKEQSIGDQRIDGLPEDYLFNAEGRITTSNSSKLIVAPAAHYNEASTREFTLTVTKNGLPSAVDPADLPEFVFTMQSLDEASDTLGLSGPIVADQGAPVDLGYDVLIDFAVDPKTALRPNGSVMSNGQDLVRTAIGTGLNYSDHPQLVSWTGDRITHFTYEVISTGHVAGSSALPGSNTQPAIVRITAEIPSLGTVETTDVTLSPNPTQEITFKGMTTRFVRQVGSTNASKTILGSYEGNVKSNDSVYVGAETRKYTVEVFEAGQLSGSSNLDARITVFDSSNSVLQSYMINDLRSGTEFDLGQGVHFEGAVFDLTASTSKVGNPSAIGAPEIVSKVNNTYTGSDDEIGVLEITHAGRVGGSAQYRYSYLDSGVTISSGALTAGQLNLPDNLKLNIVETADPILSAFIDGTGGASASGDVSAYTLEQDADFTAEVQDDGGGGQELVVDWTLADGSTTQNVIALSAGYEGTNLNIGFGVTLQLANPAANGSTVTGSIEANELEVNDQWRVNLSSGRVEVGDTFTITASPKDLTVGTTWEITGDVPMWQVGDTFTVIAHHNYNDQIFTLEELIDLRDPVSGAPLLGTVRLDGIGDFNTGDEIRIRTRGYTGEVISSGLYTDNLYPTNYIVTITEPGPIGVAKYDWVREDGRTETQFNGAQSGVITSAGPTLLEEGVEVSFIDGPDGPAYLAVGDQFVIPVGQKLEYTFAGELTLQSDENIELSHVDEDAVNTFGRMLYVGDTPDEAGTEGNLLDGPLGQNTLTGVASLSITDQVRAEEAIDTLDEAIDQIGAARASVGAALSKLEARTRSSENLVYQLSRARQQIRDADLAVEVSELVRAQTRQGASPMLAQISRLERQHCLVLLEALS